MLKFKIIYLSKSRKSWAKATGTIWWSADTTVATSANYPTESPEIKIKYVYNLRGTLRIIIKSLCTRNAYICLVKQSVTIPIPKIENLTCV